MRVNQLKSRWKIHFKNGTHPKGKKSRHGNRLPVSFDCYIRARSIAQCNSSSNTYSKNHNYQVFNWPFQCSVLFSFAYFCSQRAPVFLIEHLVERNPTKLNSNQEICASTTTHTKKRSKQVLIVAIYVIAYLHISHGILWNHEKIWIENGFFSNRMSE